MKTDLFRNWLIDIHEYKPKVVQSRVSNCKRVDRYYDLDAHFIKDGGLELLELFKYTTEDQRNRKPTKHIIPIDGDLRTGSATFKSAVTLYMTFCEDYRDNPDAHIQSSQKRKVAKHGQVTQKQTSGFHRLIKNNQNNISYKNLFGDYLKGATEFIIKDPYIRLPYQLRNFMELCRLIAETKQDGFITCIHLVTNYDEEYQKNSIQAFDEMIKSLSDQGIELSYEFSDNQHDRSIDMNNGWKIILGRGLDIWHKTNGRFDIAEYDQAKRLCKEFEVTVVEK